MYRCACCKLDKPISEWRFYVTRRASYCIACTREKDRARSQTPARKAAGIAHKATIKCKVYAARKAKEWREANPERYVAARVSWLSNNKAALCRYPKERAAALVQRTPVWADRVLMDALYACAKHMSVTSGVRFVVDHIIPLRGMLVSGLHVPLNLRIMTYEDNRRKGATFRV